MPQRKHKPEEIVAKLRQVDVLLSQGRPVAEAIRAIGVTPFTYYRWRKEFGGLKSRPGEAPQGSREGERAAAQGGLRSDAREADPARGRLGKLLSPARRRRCIDHVMTKFDVSERLACRVLGQHRSTQRKAPKGRADDAALTADIVALATQYGRYGYRRITAMLQAAGWAVNVKRVERIWRLEGLKVPGKQPKKGRLWLNDGSCVRLRPERPNHVWSYDFVEDRTHNGRKFRMLNVIDEFTRECLAIRIDRKLKSTDVIDVLSDLFILRGVPGHVRSDNGPGVHRQGRARVDRRGGGQDRLHRAGQPLGERLLREFQLEAPRRAAERGAVLQSRRGEDRHRELAPALQYPAPALEPRLQAARAGRPARGRMPHPQPWPQSRPCIRFDPGHQMGAGQSSRGGGAGWPS